MVLQLGNVTLSDVVAIAALISSAVIFWKGYRRNRKSEQIKIARELMDRINLKNIERIQYFSGRPFPDSKRPLETNQMESQRKKIEENLERINDQLSEIDYFTYLIKQHEIEDKKVIHYYAPMLWGMLDGEIRHHLSNLKHQQQRLSKQIGEPENKFLENLSSEESNDLRFRITIWSLERTLDQYKDRFEKMINIWKKLINDVSGESDVK